MGGTRKRRSSVAGAEASTSSVLSVGISTSSRITFTNGYGCVIGSTPERSSASMSPKWPITLASCSVKCTTWASSMSSRARWATLATSAAEMGLPDWVTVLKPTSHARGHPRPMHCSVTPRGQQAETLPGASANSSRRPL